MKERQLYKLQLAASLLSFVLFTSSCNNPNKDLKNAEQINTEQAYQDFIQKHPDSPLVTQAQADLEKVVYAATKREGSPAAFEQSRRH